MAAVKKSRRSRSQFKSLDDEHRQALHDVAMTRMKAYAAGSQQVGEKQMQLRQREAANEKAQQQAAGTRVNSNVGNPRAGQAYRTQQARGGARHVYRDGTSVFVRDRQAKQTGGVQEAAQRVAQQRARVIDAGAKAPSGRGKPGQGRRQLFGRTSSYHGSHARSGAFINPFPGGRAVRAESRIAGGGERMTEDSVPRRRRKRS